MEYPLIGNLDKMVWKNIFKLSYEEVDEILKEEGIEIPEYDKKILTPYYHGSTGNVYFEYRGEKYRFGVSWISRTGIGYLKTDLKGVDSKYKDGKVIPIFFIITRIESIKKSLKIHIFYHLNEETNKLEIIISSYFYDFNYNVKIYEKESLHEEKLCDNLSELYPRLYVRDGYEMPKAGWKFKEKASVEEILDVEKRLGVKFPKEYLDILFKAREGIWVYPSKYKEEQRRGVTSVAYCSSIKEVEDTYKSFREYHKPFPKKLIPIGEAAGGDYVCLDYRSGLFTKKEPSITYYVHDGIGNDRFIPLADSFQGYLDMITIDEEEIREHEEFEIKRTFYGKQH